MYLGSSDLAVPTESSRRTTPTNINLRSILSITHKLTTVNALITKQIRNNP